MVDKVDLRITDFPFADQLIELRSSIAVRDGVGVYSIFNNEQLQELCFKQPKSISELAKLPGFPEDGARVSRWGEEIISVFLAKPNTKSKAFG